jgi:hypothetical protein
MQMDVPPLYLALSLGYGRYQPEILHLLLSRGAVIKNGSPGYNQFSSITGSLLTDVNAQVPSHQVLEKSVFFYIIAEKM